MFPEFSARLSKTSLLFQPDYQSVDIAVSGRLDIWNTALRMSAAHPFNGIGVGGFRYAYEGYALPGDPFVQPDHTGAFHPHQLVLEALAEMGVFGLAGLIATYVLLIRLWRQADAQQRRAMLPYGLALLAIFFPINSHFATWSVSWGQVACFMLALYCAALGTSPPARDAAV